MVPSPPKIRGVNLLSGVRSRERGRFGFFLALSLLLNLAQTCGLVVSESLLLSLQGADSLPLTFLLAALSTVGGSLLYALGVDQAKNDRYLISLLCAFALLVCLAGVSLAVGWGAAPTLLCCVWYTGQCVLTNHFWTFVGDYFDTLAAKRLLPLFVVGASAGGAVGAALLQGAGWLGWDSGTQLLLWPAGLLLAALLLYAGRPLLRRWGPLELQEADETSITEMRNAGRFLRSSRLGHQLTLTCTCATVVAFVSQSMYSTLMLRAYPDAFALSAFLSRLLLITNSLEIALEVGCTPWLIRTLGVGTAQTVHSLVSALCLAAVAIWPGLAAATMLRFNRESLDNALAAPVRNLVYNALPARSRGRVRAFLEGSVTYAAMAISGAALLLLQSHGARLALGAAAAVGYLVSSWRVRSAYLDALLGELRAGRLDLAHGLDEATGRVGVERLRGMWRELLAEASGNHGAKSWARSSLEPLARLLARGGVWPPLLATLSDERQPPWLRELALRGLASSHWPRAQHEPLLRSCLQAADPALRRAALRALPFPTSPLARPPVWWDPLLSDPDPELRSLAAARGVMLGGASGQRARTALAELLHSPEPAVAEAAAAAVPAACADLLVELCDSPLPESTSLAAALRRLARLTPSSSEAARLWVACARRAWRIGTPDARWAALQCMTRHASELPSSAEEWSELATGLTEPGKALREACEELLGLCPLPLWELLQPHLRAPGLRVARSATHALGGSRHPEDRLKLQGWFREQIERLWTLTLAEHELLCSGHNHPYLLMALRDAMVRAHKLAFDCLAGLETPEVIRSVEKVLRFSDLRSRADALEVLSNLGDRWHAGMLVTLLESGPLEEKLALLPSAWKEAARLERLTSGDDFWLGQALGWFRGEPMAEAEESNVERMVLLRKVPLFQTMSLEQLAAIDQRLQERPFLAGEQVLAEGDLGTELYIVLDGAVRVSKSGGITLSTLGAGDYFGEMAILDSQPRSASVFAQTPTRLLTLKGDDLKDLVHEMPEIAFEIFRVLTARVRSSDDRLQELVKGRSGP